MLNALESGHHDSCTICWNRTWVLPTNTDMLVQDMEIGVCEIGSGHKTIRASIHGNKTSHLVESVESEDPIPPFQASFNLDRAGLKLTMTVQLLNKSEQIASAVAQAAEHDRCNVGGILSVEDFFKALKLQKFIKRKALAIVTSVR